MFRQKDNCSDILKGNENGFTIKIINKLKLIELITSDCLNKNFDNNIKLADKQALTTDI